VFDWVWLFEPSHLLAAQLKLNSEALEVDNNKDYNDSCNQVE
jgi:hypothetical protein